MITVYLGDNPYHFPNRWEELTPAQYVALIPFVTKFWGGEISLHEARVAWFRKIAGLESLKVAAKHMERVTDNIYTISRQFDFFFRLDYEGAIDSLSPGARKILRKTAPEDLLLSNSEIRYADQLSYKYVPEAVWAKNLIPEITINKRVLSGWQVAVDGGALTSSLTSLQFLQANDILSIIGMDKRREDMALLASVLYPGDGLQPSDYMRLDDVTLYAIMLNMQAFISFVFTKTHFSILWNKGTGEGGKKGMRVSMSDGLYSLSKSGYGDYEAIERMPAVTYLNIVRSEMISSVKALAGSKLKINEIADRTDLPVELIQKIIS